MCEFGWKPSPPWPALTRSVRFSLLDLLLFASPSHVERPARGRLLFRRLLHFPGFCARTGTATASALRARRMRVPRSFWYVSRHYSYLVGPTSPPLCYCHLGQVWTLAAMPRQSLCTAPWQENINTGFLCFVRLSSPAIMAPKKVTASQRVFILSSRHISIC